MQLLNFLFKCTVGYLHYDWVKKSDHKLNLIISSVSDRLRLGNVRALAPSRGYSCLREKATFPKHTDSINTD